MLSSYNPRNAKTNKVKLLAYISTKDARQYTTLAANIQITRLTFEM